MPADISNGRSPPKLSVLLVVYNMQREAPRTIFSALPPYQKDISVEDYEILILENGSTKPLEQDYLESLPHNIKYISVPDPSPSPAPALNWGAELAASDNLMFCIDGARIFSDELLSRGIAELAHSPDAFVYTLGWHLGTEPQMKAVMNGYNQQTEDAMLRECHWQSTPRRLFEISVLGGSSSAGPFDRIAGFSREWVALMNDFRCRVAPCPIWKYLSDT
jgi:glycosyltransferase involved in cell wall biosynthesis